MSLEPPLPDKPRFDLGGPSDAQTKKVVGGNLLKNLGAGLIQPPILEIFLAAEQVTACGMRQFRRA